MAESDRTVLFNSFLLGAVLVVAAGVAVWMVHGLGSTPSEGSGARAEGTGAAGDPFDLGPFRYDVERLQAQWRAERESFPLEVGADENRLMQAFYRINAEASEDLDDTRLSALNDRFVVDVSQYLAVHGPRAYRAVGWVLADAFREALDGCLAEARAQGVPPWTLLAGDDPRVAEWRQRLGNFFSLARRSGLVDELGELREDPTLPIVLFRYRWLAFAEDSSGPSLMTPYERVVMWRWRIEAAQGIPTMQRLAMLDQIESDYDGPLAADAVRGVLYYRGGDLEQARRYLRRAAASHPDDLRYARLVSAAGGGGEARP
jgi:hypothetical protein